MRPVHFERLGAMMEAPYVSMGWSEERACPLPKLQSTRGMTVL